MSSKPKLGYLCPIGYKQTEFGVIPEDWILQEVGGIATTVASGRSHVNSQFGDYPVYGSTGIIGRSTHNDYAGKAVLVARVGANAGKLSVVDGEYGVTDNTIMVKINSSLHMDYFWRQLEAKRLNSMVFGSGQPLITGSQIKNLVIPLPPTKAEQEAIAEALSNADALIESLEQLITKKRHIKQGAMQELLTGKKRLAGFSGEWEVKTFGEIFDYQPTATNSRSDLSEDGDSYYIHYGDIHTRFHSHLDFRVEQPPRIRRSKCRNAAFIRNGDWVMADASEDFDGVGKSIEILGLEEGIAAVAGLHTFLLREKYQTFVPGFKGHLGNRKSLHDEFLRVATGMKVFGVSKTALKNLLLSIPEPTEQTAIATILSDMDTEIAALETKLTKTRSLKQGMMHNLLTGRIRLL